MSANVSGPVRCGSCVVLSRSSTSSGCADPIDSRHHELARRPASRQPSTRANGSSPPRSRSSSSETSAAASATLSAGRSAGQWCNAVDQLGVEPARTHVGSRSVDAGSRWSSSRRAPSYGERAIELGERGRPVGPVDDHLGEQRVVRGVDLGPVSIASSTRAGAGSTVARARDRPSAGSRAPHPRR